MLLPLILMLALMYFLMIRPESKRKKQAEEMRNSLKKG
ncbi:MAG: preprotein translocase subunit YajC, partial [Oscillospiraceae bacterium]|nr:preprotein translocase subunit YajC [Oscillospiraceae bacterium]